MGRHNALDKIIGKCLMTGRLPGARVLVISSRVGYELVQKAARARLPLIVSCSRPTAIAAEMAAALNMTLVFPGRGSDLLALGNEQRVASRADSVTDSYGKMGTGNRLRVPSPRTT